MSVAADNRWTGNAPPGWTHDPTSGAMIAHFAGELHLDKHVLLVEISDPDAPDANGVKLYARDSGGGKTQIVARFATGAVQVLATEP